MNFAIPKLDYLQVYKTYKFISNITKQLRIDFLFYGDFDIQFEQFFDHTIEILTKFELNLREFIRIFCNTDFNNKNY